MIRSFFLYLCLLILSFLQNPKLFGWNTANSPFLLNSKPVSESCLMELLHGIACNDFHFECKHIGQLPSGHHIVWSDIDEPTCCISGFHIFKLDGKNLIVTDSIYGCRSSEILAGEIKENQLIYHQIASSGALLDIAANLFPEFQTYYDRSSKEGIGNGKADFVGVFKFTTFITEDGKLQEPELISFDPAEGWPPYSHKIFQKEDLKQLAFELLADIDSDKPEELKERGVAYSPICFQKLLEDDLKGVNLETKSVNISTLKNTPYHVNNHFTWNAVGQFQQYHVVYAKIEVGDDEQHTKYSGLYTIVKEGDTLRKVARLAHAKGEENQILGELYWKFNPDFFELENGSLKFQQNISQNSLKDKSEIGINLSQREEIVHTGIITIKIQIDVDGGVKLREIVGFQPSIADTAKSNPQK